ncbi:MAG: hypothetical protein AAF957_14825 [Planctomycetota bacterium]
MLLLPIILAAAQPASPTAPADGPPILDHAHARDDQENRRPLEAALEAGVASIEVDVHLVDGALLAGTDVSDCYPGRTLQKLYLDPLRARVAEHGRVHPRGPRTIQLVIDIRSRSVPTWRALRKALGDYPDLFTTFGPEGKIDGAVLAIVSGRVPTEEVLSRPRRRCAIEGWFDDLDVGRSAADVPLLSERWSRLVRWNGEGPMPGPVRNRLKALVDRAHRSGCKIRITDVPATDPARRELLRAGVDWVEVVDLEDGAAFFLQRGGRDEALRADVAKWLTFGERHMTTDRLAARLERARTPPARLARWLDAGPPPPTTVSALSNGEWVQWLRGQGPPSTVQAHVDAERREIVVEPGRATMIEIALRPDLIDLSAPLTVRIGEQEHPFEPGAPELMTLLRTRKELGRCYWFVWRTAG